MSDGNGVLPVNELVGMPVLSLSSGNKLGLVKDVFVDPLNGLLTGLTLSAADGGQRLLPYDSIYSFGHDAIMAETDSSVLPADDATVVHELNARELVGTKIITESGNLLGHIANIYVTASLPPSVVYEVRESLLDRLLGRQFYVPAAAGHALSDDRQRLVVPDQTVELTSATVTGLLDERILVRSVSPRIKGAVSTGIDDTVAIVRNEENDETILRLRDDDETVLRTREDDDTVIPSDRRQD